jgi:uncharacterized membrane protein
MSPDVSAELDRLLADHRALKGRFQDLEMEIARLRERIEQEAVKETLKEAIKESEPVPPPLPLSAAGPAKPTATESALPTREPSEPPLVQEKPPQIPDPAPATRGDVETRVGTYWLVRAGVVVLLIGFVLLGNYAYTTVIGKLNAPGKIALFYLCSIAGMIAGMFVGRKRPQLANFARVITGAGIAAVYYTTYAAHHVPSLQVIRSPVLGAIALVVWVAWILWYADRCGSPGIATLAIILGLFTSALSEARAFAVFSNLLLAAASVWLSWRHGWRLTSFLALLVVYLGYAFWRLQAYQIFGWGSVSNEAPVPVRTLFVLSYWIVFTAAVFLPGGQGPRGAARAWMLSLNNGAALGLLTMELVWPGDLAFWKLCLAGGLVLAACTWAARRVAPEEKSFAGAYLAQSLALLTLAALAWFEGYQLMLVVGVEAVLLAAAGRLSGSKVTRVFGVLVAILGAVLIVFDVGTYSRSGVIAASLLTIAAVAAGIRRLPPQWFRPTAGVPALASWGAGGMAIWEWLGRPWGTVVYAGVAFVFVSTFLLHRTRELLVASLFWIGIAMISAIGGYDHSWIHWHLLSVILLIWITGLAMVSPLCPVMEERRSRFLIGASAAVRVVACLMLAGWILSYVPGAHRAWLLVAGGLALIWGSVFSDAARIRPWLGTTWVGFGLLAFLYRVSLTGDPGWGGLVAGIMLILVPAAGRVAFPKAAPEKLRIALLIAGSVWVWVWLINTLGDSPWKFITTVSWSLFALALLVLGLLMRERALRLCGLALLGLTLARVGAVDLWRLSVPARIISAMVLGSVLVLLGYLYNRFQERIKEWI